MIEEDASTYRAISHDCRELQKQIVSGAIPVDCAFINASLVRHLPQHGMSIEIVDVC